MLENSPYVLGPWSLIAWPCKLFGKRLGECSHLAGAYLLQLLGSDLMLITDLTDGSHEIY